MVELSGESASYGERQWTRSSEWSLDGKVRPWDDHRSLSVVGETVAAYSAVASKAAGKDSCCLYHTDEIRDVVGSLLNIQQTYLFVDRYCLVPGSFECWVDVGSPSKDLHRTFTSAGAREKCCCGW